MNRYRWLLAAVVALGNWFQTPVIGDEVRPRDLSTAIRPLLDIASGREQTLGISGTVHVTIDQTEVPIEFRLVRFDDAAFDFDLLHSQYSLRIRRRRDATAMALPHHKVVFLGHGETNSIDHLAPADFLTRMISPESMASIYSRLLMQRNSAAFTSVVSQLLKIQFDPKLDRWTVGNDVQFQLGHVNPKGDAKPLLELTARGTRVVVNCVAAGTPTSVDDWDDFTIVPIERKEIERQLVRGIRRATEIFAPGPTLLTPNQQPRNCDHGEVRWIDGHRVILLAGTPEQIGTAHGQLLREEAVRCMDSVLYSFGTAQTIQSGRWFRHELEKAYSRLAPHIPEDHKRETRAMAAALQLDPKLTEVLNVFPELFHCSGFAVFGSATKDGTLYHGRVLDYMTMIGLQDAATTFIIAPDGKIPFVSVGYGGFIGSVSGMNARTISLGEMGGRGEGKWDGVPMATLMRRALEECSTLDEVVDLWKSNPRTCEYYYVFAEGKANRAVGVATTVESVELVLPGQSHERLGDGIKDAVVLSAGPRLEELRNRVTRLHGRIDALAAQSLMCRPVAMPSNLHNVLFVPADGILYVANADHRLPAADRPYVRLNFRELLKSMSVQPAAALLDDMKKE